MPVIRKLYACAALCGAALLPVPSASAYTIVFKDGSSLVTLDKYRIEGEQALVTLPSGTPTSFPASEIDVETTEELNRMGVQRGILLKGPQSRQQRRESGRSDTIADLVRGGYGDLRLPERTEKRQIRKTSAGNLDLFTLERNDPSSPTAAAAVAAYLLL